MSLSGQRGMVYALVCGHLVYIGGSKPPTSAEWTAYLDFARRHFKRGSLIKGLVVDPGSPPNPTQRKQLHDAALGYDLRVAVLTDSVLARATVTALSWLRSGYRAFTLTEFDSALAYLECDPQSALAISDHVHRHLPKTGLSLRLPR